MFQAQAFLNAASKIADFLPTEWKIAKLMLWKESGLNHLNERNEH